MRGKIIQSIAGFYVVQTADEVYRCRARGVFRELGVKPLVGDDAEIESTDEVSTPKEGSVTKIYARRNALVRPNVANVDLGVIFYACADPAPALLTIDQLLIILQREGIETLLVFNKADLISEEDREKLSGIYRNAGIPVLFVSTKTGFGLSEVKERLQGKTCVFTGPSGAGKSSFINCLAPSVLRETGEISKKIRRGKNTTRSVELLSLGSDTFLVDTPGFTSLELNDLRPEALKDCYPEFAKEESCRFLSCVHDREPDCRVKQAVREGRISRIRYANYVGLLHRLQEQAKIY